ncbi:MAG: hypothetical protein Q8L48_06010 [Archangium sp.]|nr:hypothetical protein [Archangium sp.]
MNETESGSLYGYVQRDGIRLAELRDSRHEDMFWYSFRVMPLGPDNARVLEDAFWEEGFQIEELTTGVVFKHVIPRVRFPGTPGAIDKPDRVWLRWGAGENSPNEVRQLAEAALREMPWWRRLLRRLRRQ